MSTESQSPAMSINPRSFVEQLSRALTAFQASPQNAFSVLCTLSHQHHQHPQPRRPSRPPRQLIVLDSSFNPPTIAHAELLRSAVADGGGSRDQRVLLLLAVNNADKAPKPASFPLRLAMMEAFAREVLLGRSGLNKDSSGDGLEIDVGVTTMPYFHDKATAIAESKFYNSEGEPTPEMTFLAGFDTLIRIFNPKYYGDGGMQAALDPFFERARLRVTMRTDGDWGGREEQEQYLRRLRKGELEKVGGRAEWAERVDMVEGPSEAGNNDERQSSGAISSSTVRDAVKRGDLDVAWQMAGEEVMSWIEREGLYKD